MSELSELVKEVALLKADVARLQGEWTAKIAEHDDYVIRANANVCDLNRTIERLQHFVSFVNLWCWRETKISDTERLSMIKYHPTAKAALGDQQTSQDSK